MRAVLRALRHPFRRPVPVATSTGPSYCAHQFHCRECEERIAKLVRAWAVKVAVLERELAQARGVITELER